MTRKTTRTQKSGTTTRRRPRKKAKPSRLNRFRSLFIKLCVTGLAVLIMALAWVDAIVTEKFDGKKWQIPAKVYAQPVDLYEGRKLNPEVLQQQLKRQGYQPVRDVRRPGTFSRQGNNYVIYSRGFHFPDGAEPSRKVSVGFNGARIVSLKSGNGRELPILRLDPQLIGGIYPSSYEDRLLVRTSQTPDYLIPALLGCRRP